ncbi:hypothetical protein ACIQZG_22020 [Lysinibacillus sp. NPDC096418]|uniref:hypothetical protein n=1 Tax=Lysinibacillus sp. NPDC096418 TaxID=3364138 RepID=UPI00381821E3
MDRKLIGRVGVDSGQLMIIDPCYIEEHWKKESECSPEGMKFWGALKDRATEFLQDKGYAVEISNTSVNFIKTNDKNELEVIHSLLTQFIVEVNEMGLVWTQIHNDSYEEVCELTDNELGAGQYQNVIATVFQSGFGDGIYDVYATYKDCSFGTHEDKRISKVEIILIEEE